MLYKAPSNRHRRPQFPGYVVATQQLAALWLPLPRRILSPRRLVDATIGICGSPGLHNALPHESRSVVGEAPARSAATPKKRGNMTRNRIPLPRTSDESGDPWLARGCPRRRHDHGFVSSAQHEIGVLVRAVGERAKAGHEIQRPAV